MTVKPLLAVPEDDDDVSAIDPFDVDALRRLAPEALIADRVMLSVPVRKPKRDEFIRVHPDPAYSMDWTVLVHETEMERQTYWVAPALLGAVSANTRRARIFTVVSKVGTLFLWPCFIPSDGRGQGRRWAETALVAAAEAKTTWLKVTANTGAGAYEIHKAKADFGDPVWPDEKFGDLLRLGFGGEMTIDSADHPIIREIEGEA